MQADATDPRRFAPAAAIINHRQRQKPTNLAGIAPRLRQPSQLRRREAVPQTDRRRHYNLSQKGMMNHISRLLGITRVSQASRTLVSDPSIGAYHTNDSLSRSSDQRRGCRRLTAIANAFFGPTRTSNRFARVTAV
ncbi:MAG: hypothetical protein H7243_00180 [Sphingomonadaceae bacterium]|nr:hypothetical protein [Sphingomonadaceae bacterium]